MGRLLLFAAIAAVAWYLFRRLGNPPTEGGQPQAPQAPQSPVTRCAECGVHAPETSGVRYQGQFFCGPEHLNEYLRKHGQR